MTKNRLIWNTALFLIAIISLPLAYAQTSLGGSLYFVIVNAAIIGIILFALQAYLIPSKPEKERTVVWVVVLVASLLIAWLVGRDGYIWQGPLRGFFSIYVLVNAILIGAFLYFLLGFLKIGQFVSKEGTTGYGILLFLVAMVFAVKLGNQWLWDQGTIRLFGSYLFGSEGILNPSGPKYRLWTFIGSAVLLSFFFQNYLVTGGEKKVNYALALIIAANLASGGIAIRSVVIMAEIVFLITMAKTLAQTTTTRYGTNWFVAAFLIGWGSAAATYGTEYEGGLARIVGWFLGWFGLVGAGEVARPTTGAGWFGWIGKAGIAALIPIGILVAIFFVIFRGEMRRRVLTLGLAGLKKRINSIIKSTKFLRETPEGREPQVFKENRLLLQTLVNYTTRSEITYRYKGFVLQAKKVGTKVIQEKIKKYLNQELLRKDIIVTRSGGVTQEGGHFEGWNRLNLEVVDLVNEFFELLYLMYISGKLNFKETVLYQVEVNAFASIRTRAEDLKTKVGTNRTQYQERMKAYSGHHVRNAYRYILFGMCNVTGDILEHHQKFARPGAKFDMGDQSGKPEYAGKDVNGYPTDEVNQFGEVVEDINEQKKNNKFGYIDPRDYKRPRKVKPEDVINYPDFTTFVGNIEHDWIGLAEDIRYGLWHPKSRTYEMYKQALDNGIYPEWADDNIPITVGGSKLSSPPSTGDEAFDMRALADPGKNVYWGRETFSADDPPGINAPYNNPYPLVSALGIKKYLQLRVKIDMKDKAKAVEFLNKYPADSGAAEKIVKAGRVEVPIGTRLGEGVEGQQAKGD